MMHEREAWLAMENGKLPDQGEGRTLVSSWLETRLSGGSRGALEAVLQICWDRHSEEWLSESGRAILELEKHLFLQRCEWETPRQFWSLFFGPVPSIVDAHWKP